MVAALISDALPFRAPSAAPQNYGSPLGTITISIDGITKPQVTTQHYCSHCTNFHSQLIPRGRRWRESTLVKMASSPAKCYHIPTWRLSMKFSFKLPPRMRILKHRSTYGSGCQKDLRVGVFGTLRCMRSAFVSCVMVIGVARTFRLGGKIFRPNLR